MWALAKLNRPKYGEGQLEDGTGTSRLSIWVAPLPLSATQVSLAYACLVL